MIMILAAFSLAFALPVLAGMKEENMLRLAVIRGDIKQIQSLLSGGEVQSIPKPTVLMAIQNGNPQVVKMLLDHGANANDHGVVMAAVRKGNTDMVKALLEHGADVNFKVNEITIHKDRTEVDKKVSPLDVATHSGNMQLRQLLLAHGAKR